LYFIYIKGFVFFDNGLQQILASSEPPVGVVFEIASGDDDGLEWAIPRVQSYATQLRAKFPGIKLAVVSHGVEQFQLTEENRRLYTVTQNKVENLIKDHDIDGYAWADDDANDPAHSMSPSPRQCSKNKNFKVPYCVNIKISAGPREGQSP